MKNKLDDTTNYNYPQQIHRFTESVTPTQTHILPTKFTTRPFTTSHMHEWDAMR